MGTSQWKSRNWSTKLCSENIVYQLENLGRFDEFGQSADDDVVRCKWLMGDMSGEDTHFLRRVSSENRYEGRENWSIVPGFLSFFFLLLFLFFLLFWKMSISPCWPMTEKVGYLIISDDKEENQWGGVNLLPSAAVSRLCSILTCPKKT